MKLTIFTPTYNRITELPGLFDSICEAYQFMDQEDQIEWLIIDDGSTMSLDDAVSVFAVTAKFPIVFQKKENGGKHTAFNYAIEYTTADLFVCIDDDDRLVSSAIKEIFELAKNLLDENGNLKYGAIVGRVIDENQKILGRDLRNLPIISNTIEIRDKYGFWGEPEIYCVKKLKEYRFEVFPTEKFLTEAFLFDEMSIKYPFIYTNNVFMVKKYLDGGLTSNQLKIRIESPIGTELYYYKRKNLCNGTFPKLKATINRQRFAYWKKSRDYRKKDVYEIVAKPISFLLWNRDRLLYTFLFKKNGNGTKNN